MPSLSSLPSPPLISDHSSNNRWDGLPPSEHAAQMELITSSRARHLNLTLPRSMPFPRVLAKPDFAHLGELLRQEHLAGSSQMLCQYRNISASGSTGDRVIPVICELGCCAHLPGGCCRMDEQNVNGQHLAGTHTPASYHWAILLLSVFILCVFISTLAMLVLYWTNRRHERRLRRRMLAEKCLSMFDSSEGGSSYGAAPPSSVSVFNAAGSTGLIHHQHHHSQQLYHPAFRHFFGASPSSPSPAVPSGGLPRRHFVPSSNLATSPQNLLRPCHFCPPPLHHSPSSPPSSSAYHAPDEVFFRSSF